WIPTGCDLSLVIRANKHVIWRQDSIEDARGIVQSPGLQSALTKYRDEEGPFGLTLDLIDHCGGRRSLAFRLLSTELEQQIGLDIELWSKERDRFTRHLGLASIYDDAGLFPEAADE